MVGNDFVQLNSHSRQEGISNSPPRFHDALDDKLQPSSPQPSYWKFLAEKMPLKEDIGRAKSDHCILEELECADEVDASESFAQKIQSIDAVLHIVADNHKSHELVQRRHSAPWGGGHLKSSISAPVLAKSKSRWGPPPPADGVKQSPKVPSRRNPPMMSSPSPSQSNARWSDRVDSSSQVFSSATNSRLKSLGLSELRSKSFDSKHVPKSTSRKQASSEHSQQQAPSSSSSSPSSSSSNKCRWSIPSTNSDSLLIYPQRCQES